MLNVNSQTLLLSKDAFHFKTSLLKCQTITKIMLKTLLTLSTVSALIPASSSRRAALSKPRRAAKCKALMFCCSRQEGTQRDQQIRLLTTCHAVTQWRIHTLVWAVTSQQESSRSFRHWWWPPSADRCKAARPSWATHKRYGWGFKCTFSFIVKVENV